MAHELTPRPGRPPLPIDEIIRRLNHSFAHVDLDVERASRELQDSVRYMARTGPPHFDQEDLERTRRAIGRSVYVVVAEDADHDLAYLSFLLEPEHEKIFISYESGGHEDAARDLLERLARVLDYEMELV
jgi:hypothetical protein